MSYINKKQYIFDKTQNICYTSKCLARRPNMTFPGKYKLAFRTVSAIVAGIFLLQQVVWADGGQLVTSQSASQQPSATSSTKLESAQGASIQNSVAIQSAVEQAQDTSNITIATASQTPLLAQAASSPTYIYYTDGRMQSQTLTTPDSSGMVYYHYLDENWQSQGYGRVDQSQRQAASNGEISYTYTYYTDSNGRLQQKKAYSDSSYTNLVETYTYFNDSTGRVYSKVDAATGTTYTYFNDSYGRCYSKTDYVKGISYDYYNDSTNYMYSMIMNSPDANGMIYYCYLNENWQGQGYGRAYQSERPSKLSGEWSYAYGYYQDSTGRLSIKKAYSDSSCWSFFLVSTYTYYNDSTNRMTSKTLASPDASGNTYYHYLDENYNSQGYGRVDKSQRQTADLDGCLSYTYSYFTDANGRLSSKTGYSSNNWTTVKTTSTYYNDSTSYILDKTLAAADTYGNIYYHYIDENCNAQGFGRVDKAVRVSPDLDGALSYTFTYFGATNTVQYKYCYQTNAFTALLVTYQYGSQGQLINKVLAGGYTYYTDGRMQSQNLSTPDVNGNIYYHYLDENWQGQGYGRIDQSKRQVSYNGELSYAYTYYSDSTGRLQGKLVYSDANWTTLITTFTYCNDTIGRIASKTDASTGTISTYYNDQTNYVSSTTLASPDSYGNIYYHYLDENWNSQGYGRLDEFIAAKADSEGAIAYTYQYFGQGPDIVINDNTTWSDGAYSYNSVTIAAGKTLTITGTACLYSNIGIRGTGNLNVKNGNFYVSSITCNTLTIGAGSTVTIAPIPGGPLGASMAPDYKGKVYTEKAYSDTGLTNLVYQYVNQINGDFVMTKYWPGTTAKFQDIYAKAGWIWQYSIEYWQDGTTILYKHINDPNPSTPGDVTQLTYDSQGRLIYKYIDDGSMYGYSYYENTSNLSQYYFCKPNWDWQWTIEYYEDGTIKLHSFADPDPSKTGDIIRYDYDTLGRLTTTTYDDNSFYGYSYYGNTNNIYQKWFSLPNWDWAYTVEYYEGTTTIHNKWIADNPNIAGDVTWLIYDTNGRVTQFGYDNGSMESLSYWGATSNTYQHSFADKNGVWQKSFQYYSDGVTMQYKWIADPNPSTPGDIVAYEYDAQSRIIYKYFDDGTFVSTLYWASGNKESDNFYLSGGIWQKGIEYYDATTSVMHYQYLADPNPNTPGDVASYIYDSTGRLTNLGYDNGATEAYLYYGATSNIYQHSYGAPNGAWQKTIQYYSDGVTMQYQWVVDAHPTTTGDIVSYAYDASGKEISCTLDTGEVITVKGNTDFSYYQDVKYIPSSTFAVGTATTGEIATFKQIKIGGVYLINSLIDTDGSFTSWTYDASGKVAGSVKTFSDGTIKKYDATNKLIETDVPNSSFTSGANLPWINYGYDIGGGPTGFSSSAYLVTLYNALDQWKGSTVRVFLFCDLRNGITFDASGNPTGFTSSVFNDMQALLDAAKAFDIKLIPVLFDYMIADGNSGTYLGEHPDLITDPVKKQELLDLFSGFFTRFAGDPSIYAWDVMNEPEFAGAVSISDAQSFVSDFVSLIHSKSTQAKVTVGSARRDWMLQYWTGIGLDVYEFHYYDKFEKDVPLNYSVDSLNLNKPVIAGELQPDNVSSKLNTLNNDGYAGGLFWQDQTSFNINPADYTTIRNYSLGAKAVYSYYASGRMKTETWTDGTVRWFEDAAFYNDGTGRLIKETFSDNSYTTYQYYNNTATLNIVTTFSNTGVLILKKNYDSSGNIISTTTYYSSGSTRRINNSDGTYQVFDQSGNILEQALKASGIISVRDSQNKLLREILADGIIKEYSSTGSLLRVLRPDGTSSEYYYNADGSALSRYEYSADGSFAVYDGQSNSVYTYTYKAADMQSPQADSNALSVTTALGDVINYNGSTIESIIRKSDSSIITNIELDVSGNLKNAHVIHTDGSVDIVYNNLVVETISIDGGISRYRSNLKAFDYSKQVGYTRYYYALDASNNITSITTVNKNATCSYAGSGLPIIFEKSDGSLTEYTNGCLARIVDSTGRAYLYTVTTGANPSSTLNSVIDTTNNSIPAKILYSTDGSGAISSVVLENGTSLSYSEGLLQGISGLDGNVKVKTDKNVSFDDGSYQTYYDAQGALQKITTKNKTSVVFDASGNISEINAEDGTRVLYTGGKITELYDKQEGADYVADLTGRITKVTYHNNDNTTTTFDYNYDPPLADGSIKVTIIQEGDATNVTVRLYDKDGLLVEQDLPSGVISKYTYETSGDKRILSVTQTKNGAAIGSYIYDYSNPNKTLVTDINGNKREYDTDGNIKFMYTPEGYVYQYALTSDKTLMQELVQWNKGNGITIYYKNGNVDRVETISGGDKTVLKNPVFDSTGKLQSFTVILPTGESRNCIVYDNGWTTIVTPDGTKLIYKDDPTSGNGHLVAVNSSHMLFMFDTTLKIPTSIPVDITADPQALNYIDLGTLTDYQRQWYLQQYSITVPPIVNTTVSGSTHWSTPSVSSSSSTQGLSMITSSGDTIVVSASIDSLSTTNEQGEAFLDLRYFAGWGANENLYNLQGQTLSFYVKLAPGTLTPGTKLILQAFAKDGNWYSEYSTEVSMTQDGIWYQVNLVVSDTKPICGGLKDSYFNPASIALVGIRLSDPSDPTKHTTYNGPIYIKDANHQAVPSGEQVVEFPILVNKDSVEPYVGAMPDSSTGNPNYISWSDIPTIFIPATNSGNNGQINLDTAAGRAQTYAESLGVTNVTRDNADDQWILDLNLQAGSTTNNDGEMFVDLRYDIPGYAWKGPIDLTGKTLTFKVKAPAGFIAASDSQNSPMWVQVFVKDLNYNYQYGKNIQITQEGQWLTVTLTPQVGEIDSGNSKTSPDFDPTKIIEIGVKISCNKGSVSSYNGKFYVQNATSPDILNQSAGVNLIDMNAVKNYAIAHSLNLGYADSLGGEVKLAETSLPTYFKDDSFDMATEYYPDGSVRRVLKGNSRVQYYDTEGKLIKITDQNDKTLVAYSYDSNGDLIKVDYSGTIDTIQKSMDDARVQAEQQADNTIRQLGEAKIFADTYVQNTFDPLLNEAYALKASYEAQKKIWESKNTGWFGSGLFGDCSQSQKNQMLDQIGGEIGQVNNTISDLLSKAATYYAGIDNSIKVAKEGDGTIANPGIDQDLAATLQTIADQENASIANTMNQQVADVVDYYYKKILGRSASTDEMNTWLSKAQAAGNLDPVNRKAFDASQVTTELTTDPSYIAEAANNKTFMTNVTTAITTYFTDFKNMTDAQKTAALSALGLTDAKDISYSVSDFTAILKWLSANDTHFGKSAFLSLSKVLANNGKALTNADLEDLAAKTILIDIFSGSITSLTTGEIVISMFALSKYASTKYSITLYNVELNNADLNALKDALSGGKYVIAMVSGNHFVVVTQVAADGTVSYYDPSSGSSGQNMTMKASDFLKAWNGYAITQKAPLLDKISKVISDAGARLIRGSDPFTLSVLAIIAIVSAFTSVILGLIDNQVCQLLSKIFAIVATFAAVFNLAATVYSIITDFSAAITAMQAALEDQAILIGNMFSGSVEGFVVGMATMMSTTVIGISLDLSFNKALTTFGLNSDLAGITSAFLAGGFSGIYPGMPFSVVGGLTSLTIEGIRYAGKELNLDPIITGLIGTTAATIVSAGLGGVSYYDTPSHSMKFIEPGLDAISYTMRTTVLPNLASEIAYYGINKLGEAMGIDSIVNQAIGIGIRSTISAAFRGGDTNSIYKSALGGLVQGVASIGINYATQELGLNPLLASLGFSAIASAINAGLQAATGGSQDVFKTFFDTYTNNALTFLGYGDPSDPNYASLEASYKYNIIDFSDKVRERGFVDALNTYGVSFFNSTTLGAIAQSDLTIGKFFDSKIANNQYTTFTASDGTQYIDVPITVASLKVADAFFDKLTLSDGTSTWLLAGKEEYYSDHTSWSLGDLGVDDYAKLGFRDDATLQNMYNTYKEVQIIDSNGNLVSAVVTDSNSNNLVIINPSSFSGSIQWNAYGDLVDAIVKNTDGSNFEFNQNLNTTAVNTSYNPSFTDADLQNISQKLGLSVDDIKNTKLTITYNGENIISLNAVFPTGKTPNLGNNPSALSLIFGDVGEVIIGKKSGTDVALSSFSRNFREIFSIYNFMPASLFSWYNQNNVFTQVWDAAVNLATSQAVKDVINYMGNLINNAVQQFPLNPSNMTEEQKEGFIGNLQKTLDGLEDAASKNYAKADVDQAEDVCTDVAFKFFNAAQDTQGYKDTVKGMKPMNQALIGALQAFLKFSMDNKKDN